MNIIGGNVAYRRNILVDELSQYINSPIYYIDRIIKMMNPIRYLESLI